MPDHSERHESRRKRCIRILNPIYRPLRLFLDAWDGVDRIHKTFSFGCIAHICINEQSVRF